MGAAKRDARIELFVPLVEVIDDENRLVAVDISRDIRALQKLWVKNMLRRVNVLANS